MDVTWQSIYPHLAAYIRGVASEAGTSAEDALRLGLPEVHDENMFMGAESTLENFPMEVCFHMGYYDLISVKDDMDFEQVRNVAELFL